MEHQPLTAVWELTMACNMRCRHCGSSCNASLPGELTTTEALELCDQLAELGVRRITLSGGEPLLRKDWPEITRRLVERGVHVAMISNGWLVDGTTVEEALQSGLGLVAVSLDGLETAHDRLRRPGAFRGAVNALTALRAGGMATAVITTAMRTGLPDLPQIPELLVSLGVGRWQLQFGFAMGNLAEHREEVLTPSDVVQLLDLAHRTHREGRLRIDLGDCLGYFTRATQEIRTAGASQPALWPGCPAGRFSLGIRHNGDVCGCNSLRDESLIEGNLRETPLEELWHRPGAFAWNRTRTRSSLSGYCRGCQFADLCLAGCSTVRRFMSDDPGDNPYCARRLAIEPLLLKVEAIEDVDRLAKRAAKAIDLGLLEVADRCLSRAVVRAPERLDLLLRSGYVAFRIGDFERCLQLNSAALRRDPGNAYALKGLGLARVRLGQTEAGLAALRASADRATPDFTDPLHDLAVVLIELGRRDEARQVLDRGVALAPGFVGVAAELYRECGTAGQGLSSC